MAQSVPQLDVFYIDFTKGANSKHKSGILNAIRTATSIAGSAVIPAAGIAGRLALSSFLTPVIFKEVKTGLNLF